MHPAMKTFITEIEEIIKLEENESRLTEKVSERLKKIVVKQGIIPDIYKQPNPDKYTLYPVYIDPDNRFSIASAVWDVGQSTPIHDHGTWGVIGIIQGKEREIHYAIQPGQPPLKEFERNLQKGDVVVCCTSDQDLHEVHCASSEPCVGLHIYGGNIGEIERHIYDSETGKKTTVVTAWDKVPKTT